jgi:UDP-glucose 4-epimerase
MNMKNKWLITGGCGFIGINLIKRLRHNYPEARIRVLDNLLVGKKEDLEEVCNFHEVDASSLPPYSEVSAGSVHLIIGDIRDFSACSQCCKDADIIVHLAANTGVAPSVENPQADMEANVIGTFNMLEAARRNSVSRFIFASSGAPIGETEPPIHEEKAPRPVSPYGASKLAGEGYCSAYYRTFGIKTVALRFGNIYGPGSKHKSSVVAKFIKNALSGDALEVFGDGGQTRDFIYIDDMIEAILLSAKTDVGGEVFQIATFKETTINEITSSIQALFEKVTGKTVPVIHGSSRLGDVRRNYSDITKATKILGFKPRYDLERGLTETLNYFIKREGGRIP